MGETENIKRYEAEGLPAEEGVQPDDFDERLDQDPDEHVNRPDQPDFSDEERRQYDEPRQETAIADADRPEDR